jgi:putative ABC transport system permease protein
VFQLAIKGVRFNVARYVATLVAIITGVAFFAAAGFASDRVISALEGDVTKQYGNVDTAVVVDDSKSDAKAFAEQLRIPQDVVDEIADLPNVEGVGGELTGPVAFGRANGSTFADGAIGRLWIEDQELNPLDVIEGKAPESAGDIAVDKGLADNEGLEVGDTVTVLSVDGENEAKIVGITEFGGNADSIDQKGTVSIPEASAFDWLNSGLQEYKEVYVRGSGDQAALAKAVGKVIPAGFVAKTGAQFLDDKRGEVASWGKTLKVGLQFFAVLALFVGGFVIYNTFSVIVAQRQRELAVLSAIGATPKQLKRSLRFEGLVIGIVGSILGVIVGAILTFGLVTVLNLAGVSLPGSGIKIKPSNVISAVLFGTIITLVSVMIPARRAAKTEPIEALRDAAAETGENSRTRGITALVLVVVGFLLMVAGGKALTIGLGIFLLIIGVIVAGPFIATGGARLMRPLVNRFGLEWRLAVDNSARNPKRTATTANALLIGVFLVTLVTVAGQSVKDFVVSEIQNLEGADFTIRSDGGSIDDGLVNQLESIKGVEKVTPFRRESVTITGQPSQLSTLDTAAVRKIAKIEAKEGSLDDLGPGTIALIDDSSIKGANDKSVAIGDKVKVANASGDSVNVKVVAVLKSTIDSSEVGSLVDTETFDGLVGETAPIAAFIDVTDGDQTDTQDRIDDRLSRRPDITLSPGNTVAKLIKSVFDFLINAVTGLLLMSVLVALIGIINTLSLSLLERRRELGLLRVMGMTDVRVRRMVRRESALIAALGTASGVVLGFAVGWGLIASIDRLSDASIGLGFPGEQILLVLVLGVILGYVSAIIPARRATRAEVLDAIQSA